MYLLDTNIVSYFLRGEGNVGRRMLALPYHELAISSLSDYELWRGALIAQWSTARMETTFAGLARFPRLEFTSRDARVAAQISASLSAVGQPIGHVDSLIAGVALANGVVLVTRNTREFGRIPGLRVEDWY